MASQARAQLLAQVLGLLAEGAEAAQRDQGRAEPAPPLASHQLAVGRSGPRYPGRRLRPALLGIHGVDHLHQVDARRAVDHAVVQLAEHREAVALETLDQPDLPERLGAVEVLALDARGLGPQLLQGSGPGQGRVADVVVEVEVRIVDPHGVALDPGST